MRITLPKFLRRGEAKATPTPRRYLSDQPQRQEAFLAAARSYVANTNEWETAYLHRKPFLGGHLRAFLDELYPVLNLIEAMAVPARGRILEVGCGPGWVTEILALLDYEVHAIEPSEDMIAIARRRLRTAVDHYKLDSDPKITFYPVALEEGIALPSESIDGVIFHAALHHVVDEHKGLAECFRLLKAGGVLGVSEWAWKPGDKNLEATLEQEMRRFGTLENPFSRDYLDAVLTETGFVNTVRFHSFNGFVPAYLGETPVEKLAQAPASSTNNLTARKPYAQATTADHGAGPASHARMTVDKAEWSDGRSALQLTLTLENTGSTVWTCRGIGAVKVSLRAGELGATDFIEAARILLPTDVPPGATITLQAKFVLPKDAIARTWVIDMLAEDCFWFSANGNTFPPVS